MLRRGCLGLLVLVSGCSEPPPPSPPVTPPPPVVASPTAVPLTPPTSPPSPAPPNVAPPVAPPGTPAPPAEAIPAAAGVGSAGRSLDQHEGPIVTAAKTYFTVRERIVFEDQIPKAMQLHKATNGTAPQTHEEFMQLIAENQIALPKLRNGERYVYDPKTEQLMVERPRR